MAIWQRLLEGNFQIPVNKPGATNEFLRWRIWRYAIVVALGMAFTSAFGGVSFAQREDGSGTRRGYTLFGDVKVDESQVTEQKAMILDVILYNRGGEVIARQRVSNNGRYRFLNIFNGEYYVAIELESTEVARVSVLVTGQLPTDVQKDIELVWRPGFAAKSRAATVLAADAYDRKGPNKNRFEKAQEAFDKKEYDKAVALFSQIVTDDPQDFQALSELGTVYFAQKNFSEAEKAYKRATEIRPTFFLALLNLGRLRLLQKNFDGAISALDQAATVQPTSAEARYFLGEAYLQIKKGSKAVGYLNEAIKLDPIGMADAHLRLATLYNGAGMKDKAAAEYEQFLKKKPDYPDRKKLEQYIAENKKH